MIVGKKKGRKLVLKPKQKHKYKLFINRFFYSHIYMLRIAGQTAEPIGLKFVGDTYGWLGGVIG